MAKAPGMKPMKMPAISKPPRINPPGMKTSVKAMKPVTARGQESPATAGVEQDRIMTRVKRPVRTKVPRVI